MPTVQQTADRLGRIQQRIRRAFIANPGAELTTKQLVEWAYPRETDPTVYHRKYVRHAAHKVAKQVLRSNGGRGYCAIWAAII